jgi:hypothetical protein
VCTELASTLAIDAFESCPWLETVLLAELLTLFFNDLLIL